MQTVTPFLWFDNNCEEAMNFYAETFKNASITNLVKLPDGSASMGSFQINGQEFMALNGGPLFKFNESISLFVSCEDQAEVDELWEKLTTNGGEESRCGWLKDKFGLSWQIIPKVLGQLVGGPDPKRAHQAMEAMMGMSKIIVADLEAAYNA